LPTIVGFDRHQLGRHYQKHGRDFPGARDRFMYERPAVEFVTSDRPGIEECVRSDGDTVFFDPLTGELAVCAESGLIRTYFRTDREYYARTCEE